MTSGRNCEESARSKENSEKNGLGLARRRLAGVDLDSRLSIQGCLVDVSLSSRQWRRAQDRVLQTSPAGLVGESAIRLQGAATALCPNMVGARRSLAVYCAPASWRKADVSQRVLGDVRR